MKAALKVVLAPSLLALTLAVCITTAGSVVPPKNGGQLPQWYFDIKRADKTAFQFQYAWIHKARRIKEKREAYVRDRGFYQRDFLAAGERESMSVTGTISVPVFCSKFSNTGADPWTIATLQNKLYDGPGAPQTLTELYDEMSYGDITLTGTVFGWTQLANVDTYYEGPPGCNGLCASGNLDDYVNETLTDQDGGIDFGQFDNDGPDGVPNSGDDDGFVDFVAFVHPEVGAECGGTLINIWSHRWNLNSLMGAPWTTNDARAGGGFIRVNDYVMQPALNCDGTTIIDIGVFAHEYGHAFGLPDLYDTDGGTRGAGSWALMANGPWNTPDYPAHLCLWSKAELGWANLMDVGSTLAPYTLDNIEQNRTGYRLNVMHERWRRMAACAIGGSYSMRCGLTAAEGAARGWGGGDGYGDMWDERLMREFSYNGSNPVTLQYDYSYDSEEGYDYTYVRIDVNGTKSTVATYHNAGGVPGSGTENVDLTTYLNGSGASSYTVSFEFQSDVAWSDRDGAVLTTCGPFVVDNIFVNGGGESYSTDFEAREDGWHVDMTSPAEYFLVENRQPVGSDINLAGGGGLVVWHINQDVTRTGQSGNTAGASGNLEQGVYPEQADGQDHLRSNTNPADAGDPFPGSTNNTTFNDASSPSSKSDDGIATNVNVVSISSNPANGGSMTAEMSGGWPLPTYTGVNPGQGNNDAVVLVTVGGSGFAHGLGAELIDGGTTIAAQSIEWVGKNRVIATFDLTGRPEGDYDVRVVNPGGGEVVAVNAFRVNNVVPTALRSLYAREVDEGVEVSWLTIDQNDILGWRVYRSVDEGIEYERLTEEFLPAEARSYLDDAPARGEKATYRLTWLTPDGEQIAGHTSVAVVAMRTAMGQNFPNPFNPVTTIPFDIGGRTHVRLTIYNIAGQLVRTLVDETLDADSYAVEWDGRDESGAAVASGVYFYKLMASRFHDVRKLVLAK